MKKFYFLVLAVLVSFSVNAQTYFSDDFSGGDLSNWTTSDEDGDAYDWYIFDYGDGVYDNLATSASWTSTDGAINPDNWLISGAIDLSSATNPTLYFDAFGQDPDWSEEHYAVYISTSDAQVASFTTTLFEETLGADGEVTSAVIDLSDYAGQVVYIAFRHYDITDMFRINIDNVVVKEVVYNVTFNVDMNQAITDALFDASTDTVFVTGSFLGWAAPGDDVANQMLTDDDADGIYTLTREDVPGNYAYKYFKNSGWDNGEWTGDPNREYDVVDADVVLNNTWGGDPVEALNGVAIDAFVGPNPTNGILKISAEGSYSVSVIDMAGKVVLDGQMTNYTEIDLSNQEIGTYVVRLTNAEGSRSFKVVKK